MREAFTTRNLCNRPTGRKKGVPDRRTKLRDLLEPHAPALVERVLAAALDGDMVAMKLCLDRICPTIKPVSQAEGVNVDLSGTPVDQCRAILSAAVSGQIPVEEATQLLAGIANCVKVQEVTEITARLDALEATLGG